MRFGLSQPGETGLQGKRHQSKTMMFPLSRNTITSLTHGLSSRGWTPVDSVPLLQQPISMALSIFLMEVQMMMTLVHQFFLTGIPLPLIAGKLSQMPALLVIMLVVVLLEVNFVLQEVKMMQVYRWLRTECYNPVTQAWTTRVSLPNPRARASYGTTCDGKLMLAGGDDGTNVFSDVSVFDGLSWSDFPPLKVPRQGTTTLAMDCPCGQIYSVSGAATPGRVLGGLPAFATEHYFPDGVDETCQEASAAWAIVPAPVEANWVDQSAACFVMGPDNRAIYIGGYKKEPLCFYDPNDRSWTCQSENFPKRTHHSQCILVGNDIYFMTAWGNRFAGDDTPTQDNDVPIAQKYSITDDTWTFLTGIDASRFRAAAAVAHLDGFIYLSHGSTNDDTTGASVFLDRYSIATDSWETLPDASFARHHTGGGIVGDEFCVAGGRDDAGAPVAETECYNPVTQAWTTKAPMPAPRSAASYGTTCEGGLILAGGQDDANVLSDVTVFDGTSWSTLPSLRIARQGTTTLAIDCPCGQYYMASGTDRIGRVQDGLSTDSTEHFFPGGTDETCQ